MKTFQAPFVHGLSIAEKKRPPTVMVGGFLMGWNQAIPCLNMLAGVLGSRTHLPRSSRGITDLKPVPIRTNRFSSPVNLANYA